MNSTPRQSALWEPSTDDSERAEMARFMHWAGERRGYPFSDYGELWQWSVDELEAFWSGIWEFYGVHASKPYKRVLGSHEMPGTSWFEGAELNYAENVLTGLTSGTLHKGSGRDPATIAILYSSELGGLGELTWGELSAKVAAAAGGLRTLGVARGDRVVAYMPNVPETVIAFLAVASIGAIWSSAAPEFGARSVIDRFAQIEPKVLITVDGYHQDGRDIDRIATVRSILEELHTVEHVVLLPNLSEEPTLRESLSWQELLQHGEGVRLHFEQVPFNHPLWVLYSSGTTGLPKAIVQGHGGILIEQLKMSMHLDLRPDDRMFWFTTTGWMMWNFLVGCLFSDAAIVLYDGSPAYPDFGALWRLTERTGITCMGVSASILANCEKAGVRPSHDYDLHTLRAIGSTGSPLASESFRWVHEHVGSNIWLASISGGTDVCTAFLAGCPLLPVYEGELQCRALGCAVESWDTQGHSLIDEVGELVITKPMPSMPLFFWDDASGERLRESYFSMYPGVWRHGDWIRITPRGGAVIYGRSDSTINRQGVRIGTSEIYRAAGTVAEVLDALVVDVPNGDEEGELWMVLFVVLTPGTSLDDGLTAQIKRRIREDCSARYVPNEVRQIEEVPRTLSGKVLEVPVKRILMGATPSEAASVDSLANPTSLDYFMELAGKLGRGAGEGVSQDAARSLVQKLACLEEADRNHTMLELVLSHVAEVLKPSDETIDPQRTFQELGFDSLSAVELLNRLGKSVGLHLHWTLIFDQPTPEAVAKFLLTQVEGAGITDSSFDQTATTLGTTGQTHKLTTMLEAVEQRLVPPHMPRADLMVRVKTSPWVRGVLPAQLLVRRATCRGQKIWEENTDDRHDALATMEAIISGTSRACELHELARMHLIESQVAYEALFWQQPWSAKVDPESSGHLHAALSDNRGVLLSACHLGPFYRMQCAPPFKGRETYMVAGPWFFEPPSPGIWGRRVARWRKGTKSHPIPSEWSFPIILALLERGDSVLVHFDVPGPHETYFMGKPTMLADGSAQLAVRADALVLPLRARRVGYKVWIDVDVPLDPRRFEDADALHNALAAQHERWILENPAAMEKAEVWE